MPRDARFRGILFYIRFHLQPNPMKRLLIFLSFFLLPYLGFCQHFGDTKEQIKKGMTIDTSFAFLKEKLTKEGAVGLVYQSKSCIETFYLDKKGTCDRIIRVYEMKDLEDLIAMNDRNNNNVKSGNLEWLNPTARVKCTIQLSNNNGVFAAIYTEIK